jgi:glucose-6-phosphate dehydrogenase assembly protein OpcA
MAHPRLVWQSEDASLGAIEEALRRTALQPAEAGAPTPPPRSRALTLVMVADGEDERRADAAARLALRHPLRAILVARLPADGGPALSARIRRHNHPGQGSAVIAEEVDLRVRGELADHLGQLLSPLLLSELPAVFWWVGTPPLRSPVFAELCQLCDRGVIELRDPGDLAAVPDPGRIADVTWHRQAPWRDKVAGLFDPPDHRAAAGEVRSVEIAHGAAGGLGGHLLGGWIASRLGLGPAAVRLREVEGAGAHGLTEAALTTGAGHTYRVRASANGEYATCHRPDGRLPRVRLGALTVGEAMDHILAGPADPLWPPALEAARDIAAAGPRAAGAEPGGGR